MDQFDCVRCLPKTAIGENRMQCAHNAHDNGPLCPPAINTLYSRAMALARSVCVYVFWGAGKKQCLFGDRGVWAAPKAHNTHI